MFYCKPRGGGAGKVMARDPQPMSPRVGPSGKLQELGRAWGGGGGQGSHVPPPGPDPCQGSPDVSQATAHWYGGAGGHQGWACSPLPGNPCHHGGVGDSPTASLPTPRGRGKQTPGTGWGLCPPLRGCAHPGLPLAMGCWGCEPGRNPPMVLDGALWLGRGQGEHSTRVRPPEQDPARGVGGARQAGQQAGCRQGQGLSPCAPHHPRCPYPELRRAKLRL